MRLECVETLVDATVSVLGDVLGGSFGRGEVALTPEAPAPADVAIRLAVSGALEGRVVLAMDATSAVRLAVRMSGGGVAEDDPLVLDCVGELGNMIVGRAVSALNDAGLDVRLGPPEVAGPGRAPEGGPPPGEACVIPIWAEVGALSVVAVLREP